MKRLMVLAALAVLICFGFRATYGFEGGDTGTYRILDYKVSLTPHTDGTVGIEYYQKWQVTDGHVPWITVGVPSSDYQITGSSMAVKDVSSSGDSVRLDLDKDYQPSETFEIRFSITQNHLFYADDTNYHLDFTPGWYDRAAIDKLEIRIKPFAKLSDITSDPAPSSQTDEELVWNKQGLSPGDQFKVSISFPKTAAPTPIPEENVGSPADHNDGIGTWHSGPLGFFVTMIVMVVVIVLIIIYKWGTGGYSGGNMWFGGGGSGGSDGGSDSERSSSGGGGFGGSSYSCACACVSCACACACAGGGGAGCSRKQEHRCPVCAQEEKPE